MNGKTVFDKSAGGWKSQMEWDDEERKYGRIFPPKSVKLWHEYQFPIYFELSNETKFRMPFQSIRLCVWHYVVRNNIVIKSYRSLSLSLLSSLFLAFSVKIADRGIVYTAAVFYGSIHHILAITGKTISTFCAVRHDAFDVFNA